MFKSQLTINTQPLITQLKKHANQRKLCHNLHQQAQRKFPKQRVRRASLQATKHTQDQKSTLTNPLRNNTTLCQPNTRQRLQLIMQQVRNPRLHTRETQAIRGNGHHNTHRFITLLQLSLRQGLRRPTTMRHFKLQQRLTSRLHPSTQQRRSPPTSRPQRNQQRHPLPRRHQSSPHPRPLQRTMQRSNLPQPRPLSTTPQRIRHATRGSPLRTKRPLGQSSVRQVLFVRAPIKGLNVATSSRTIAHVFFNHRCHGQHEPHGTPRAYAPRATNPLLLRTTTRLTRCFTKAHHRFALPLTPTNAPFRRTI